MRHVVIQAYAWLFKGQGIGIYFWYHCFYNRLVHAHTHYYTVCLCLQKIYVKTIINLWATGKIQRDIGLIIAK